MRVKAISKKFNSPLEMFEFLRSWGLPRLDNMVIDSAFKGMPMYNLDKTLLMMPDQYNKLLQDGILEFDKMIKYDTWDKDTL